MDVKQKQCLLEYLGYYDPENGKKVNNIDGIYGEKTKAATKAFQYDYGLEDDGVFGPLTEDEILLVISTGKKPGVNWDDIENFEREEFRCPCGECNGFPAEPAPALVKVAQRVREHFGSAAIISSGVRCEKHNAEVGGVKNSRHLTGRAMDFRVKGKTAAQVLDYVNKQPEIRYAYDIDGTYIHMDIG